MSDFTVGGFRSAHRPSLRRVVADAVLFLQAMMRARATRRLLPEMDDRLLSDTAWAGATRSMRRIGRCGIWRNPAR